MSKNSSHGQIISISDKDLCLDTAQLTGLEQSFREWAQSPARIDAHLSRLRILIIFLLIRYTGAKLNEVLALNPYKEIDWKRHLVRFKGIDHDKKPEAREVQISETLSTEIRTALTEDFYQESSENLFDVDPGFVRRKFYERVEACGFSKRLGGPEMIRKARAVELMKSNMPLPAVQIILGHSTPNLTSSYVSFSKDEVGKIARIFMEKESVRKTSARNSFFGKIQEIRKGDIQTRVVLATMDGFSITTIITNDSVERLGLSKGRLITAEVKAPWVILSTGHKEPLSSAENKFRGIIIDISRGKVNTECIVRISEMTEVCAVLSTRSSREFSLSKGDEVWVMFNCFSVVLHVDVLS